MKSKKVIVALSLGSISGRNCLSGVFDFVNAGHDWNIQFVQNPDELTTDFVKQSIAAGVRGFFTGFRTRTDGLRTLEESDIPVVFTDYPKNEIPDPSHNNALIRNDDIAIGREAARHLLAHGNFRSFAFIPTQTPSRWSTLRERGFRLQLAESHILPRRFPAKRALVDFLSALQKPAAVMAATDFTAVRILESCHAAGLSVPEQIAIISVDNDELLCNTARPTLSSIQPDHEGLGRLGAEMLDCLMSGRKIPKRIPTHIKSTKVVERDSTRVIPPAGFIVREALAFIKSNAAKGIGVEDVVRHLGVSRRLLYFRFQQMTGKSIHETILDTRLALVRQKLVKTTLPLIQIAAECGFRSSNRLSHLFYERFKTYPMAFRKHEKI